MIIDGQKYQRRFNVRDSSILYERACDEDLIIMQLKYTENRRLYFLLGSTDHSVQDRS